MGKVSVKKLKAIQAFVVALLLAVADRLDALMELYWSQWQRMASKVPFQRLLASRHAIIRGIIVTIISVMVMLLVAIILIQALVASQNTTLWSGQAKTAWASLQANIWVAVTLLVILPIILGAVAILAYLRFGTGGEGQGP
jgi:hypothetical protein